eukprot:6482704-Amphidinium_carterae.1
MVQTFDLSSSHVEGGSSSPNKTNIIVKRLTQLTNDGQVAVFGEHASSYREPKCFDDIGNLRTEIE